MKKSQIIAILGFAFLATVTSCKKDYVCTCTTVVGGLSTDIKHDIDNANVSQATKSCQNYEDQANASLPGGTTCHL